MATLARLGMADAPTPVQDPERAPSLASRPSRASLPPTRRTSHRSLHSSASRSSLTGSLPPPLPGHPSGETGSSWPTLAVAVVVDEDELPWGPAHPCFPHPNPHVAAGSAEEHGTRVVRVPRDWLVAGDAYPAFANVYPEILGEWVGEDEFRALVVGINERLRKAFDAGRARSVVDAVLGVATGWLWEDLGLTGVKRGVGELERWVEAWNLEREREGNPARVIPLRRTGYMNLDIQIPDPEIDVV